MPRARPETTTSPASVKGIAFVPNGTPTSTPPTVGLTELTPREQDVLRLIAKGHNNGEIADELCISGLTVKTHIGRIFTKLGLRDRAAAIVFAYEQRIIAPS